MAAKIGKPKKKSAPAPAFPPQGLPPIKDLLAAVEQAAPAMLTVVTMMKAWEAFGKVPLTSIKFAWKKLVPKLGSAIRQMLGGKNLPPILQAIVPKAADLGDQDTLVQQLEGALANANTLVAIFSALLRYYKTQYYKQSTGISSNIRGLTTNELFDADQRHEVEKQAKLVLQVDDEMAQEPIETRKTNQAIRDKAKKEALAKTQNPELDAKELELRAVRGGSITAQDLTQDAAPKESNRRNKGGT